MDAKQHDLEAVARLTPEAKLRMLSGMIEQAWALKEAWLRMRDPDAPASEIRSRARSIVGEPAS
jgi:hypothetical protein